MFDRLLSKFGLIGVTVITTVMVMTASLILALVVNPLIGRQISYQTFLISTLVPLLVAPPFIYAHFSLILKLQEALDEIKTLRGIIPICSHCKQIRDDQGLWKQLEAYISDHSEAQFTHGICPDCQKKHYPNLGKLKNKMQHTLPAKN